MISYNANVVKPYNATNSLARFLEGAVVEPQSELQFLIMGHLILKRLVKNNNKNRVLICNAILILGFCSSLILQPLKLFFQGPSQSKSRANCVKTLRKVLRISKLRHNQQNPHFANP
jgi:hypothetical protein